MTLLKDTADWFKARETVVERYFEDGEGRYAFKVTPRDESFMVCALSKTHRDGTISVMEKVVRRADDNDWKLLIRVKDDKLVYEPKMFLQHNRKDTITDDRKSRGEAWLKLPKDWGCRFRDYMDGNAEPQTNFGDLRDFEYVGD